MKLIFENILTESYVEMFEDALDSVPDIDTKMIDWFFEHPQQMEDFVSSKLQHLYDDEDFDEDFDVSNKEKTIGHDLNSLSPEVSSEINSKLSDAEYRIRPFNQVKKEIIDLIDAQEFMANPAQKRRFLARLEMIPTPRKMMATLAAYMVGIPSIETERRKAKGLN